jgi:branched-chain amino acid transport system substrate-binding protein
MTVLNHVIIRRTCLSVLLAAILPAVGFAADVVKVGFPAPLTGPGATIGNSAIKGARTAVDEINKGGLAGPYKIELVIEDGACSPAGASAATEKLISAEKVNALLGAVCSSATIAATDVAQREKIPMVVAISSADKITERKYDYIFRTTPTDTGIVNVFSNYVIAHAKPKRMAFVFEQTDWGQEGSTMMRQQMEKAGVQIVGFEGVSRSVQNFLPMLTKLKEANPDAVFLMLLEPQGLQLIRQATEAGLHTRFMGTGPMGGISFVTKGGPELDGMLIGSLFEPRPSDPISTKFVTEFKNMHGQDPDFFAALVYDAMKVLGEAIRQAGPNPEKIRDALGRTKDFPGTVGPTTFDEHGQASKGGYVVEWRNKERKVLWP